MEIFNGSWQDFSDVKPSVVTVGSFDGVHLGHRTILDRVVDVAKSTNQRSVIVSFDPHPRKYFSKSIFPLLSTAEEKLEQLERLGLDLAILLTFDEKLAATTAQDFVQYFLKARLGMTQMIIGL